VNPEPHLAEQIRLWLTALTTPALATVAGWIALQQYRLQRYRLRHDLSERRLAVFTAARDFARTAVTKLEASDEALVAFDVATAQAPFLFGADVIDYLAGLRHSYCILLGVADQRQLGDIPERPEGAQARSDWVVQRQWLRDELKKAQQVFRPYLDLSTAR
jgi:hypothetical protein